MEVDNESSDQFVMLDVEEAEFPSDGATQEANKDHPEAIKYNVHELVYLIGTEKNPQSQCVQCNLMFSSQWRSTIQRHYERSHNTKFLKERNVKAPKRRSSVLSELIRETVLSHSVDDAQDTVSRVKYIAEELVEVLGEKPNKRSRCKMCGVTFTAVKRYTIQRHYEAKHGYRFYQERFSIPAPVEPSFEPRLTADNSEIVAEESNNNDSENESQQPAITYVLEDLVELIGTVEKPQSQCKTCGFVFTSRKRSPIQTHYQRQHNYNFISGNRPPKKKPHLFSSRVSFAAQPVSQAGDQEPSRNNTCAPESAQQYLTECVKHHENNSLNFAYWDSSFTQKLHSGLQGDLGVKITAERMEKHIQAKELFAQENINKLLADKVFSLRLDIKLTAEWSYLTVVAELVHDFNVKRCLLGVLAFDNHKPLANGIVKRKFEQIIVDHYLDMDQIYCMSLGNSFEVIKSEVPDSLDEEERKILKLSLTKQITSLTTGLIKVPRPASVIKQVLKKALSSYQEDLENIQGELLNAWDLVNMENGMIQLYDLLKVKVDNLQMHCDTNTWIEDLLASLLPIYKLYKRIQEPTAFLVGDLVRDLLLCERELINVGNSVALNILGAFEIRKQILFENRNFLGAVYLDPRLNNKTNSILTVEEKATAVCFLVEAQAQNEMVEMMRVQGGDKLNAEDGDNWMKDLVPSTGDDLEIPVEDDHDEEVTSWKFRETIVQLESRQCPLKDVNVLDYWRNWPDEKLARLATVVLSYPVSQLNLETILNAHPGWVFRGDEN